MLNSYYGIETKNPAVGRYKLVKKNHTPMYDWLR